MTERGRGERSKILCAGIAAQDIIMRVKQLRRYAGQRGRARYPSSSISI